MSEPIYIAVMVLLAAVLYAASKYFERRQARMAQERCIRVTGRVVSYAPLEGVLDRKGRTVAATRVAYEVEGKPYEIELDDQIAEADQEVGEEIPLLCDKEDPSQCFIDRFPVKKGWF